MIKYFNLKHAYLLLKKDLWSSKIDHLPKWQRYSIKTVRISLLAMKSFKESELILRSSALTFYTLLSIVPIVGLIFGISKGFGLEQVMKRELYRYFSKQPEILDYLLEFSNRLLNSTKGGLIAGIGFALLLWSVLQVLGNIESAFNNIWRVKKDRTWVRKFTDYLAIMLIAPLLIVFSGSITVFLNVQIDEFTKSIALLGPVRHWILFGLQLSPYILIWLIFSMIYLVMPNTRVKISAAIVAGIIAGSAFQLFEYVFINLQIGVARFNAIYGSFASFPLFITWLQLSWTIVLIGADISFSIQNINSHEREMQQIDVSHRSKIIYALGIMKLIVVHFRDELKAPTVEILSEKLEMPVKLAGEIVEQLIDAELIVAVNDEKNREIYFLPKTDISKLTAAFIIERIETTGEKIALDYTPPIEIVKSIDFMNSHYKGEAHKNLNKHILEI
jgi:membrane protein